jgi:Fe-S-cluster-containing dehydrogenase component
VGLSTNVIYVNYVLLIIKKPACVSICPTPALDFSFETIDNSEIPHSVIVPVQTKPSVVIKEIVNENGPRIDQNLFKPIKDLIPPVEYKAKITASSEWTLGAVRK